MANMIQSWWQCCKTYLLVDADKISQGIQPCLISFQRPEPTLLQPTQPLGSCALAAIVTIAFFSLATLCNTLQIQQILVALDHTKQPRQVLSVYLSLTTGKHFLEKKISHVKYNRLEIYENLYQHRCVCHIWQKITNFESGTTLLKECPTGIPNI